MTVLTRVWTEHGYKYGEELDKWEGGMTPELQDTISISGILYTVARRIVKRLNGYPNDIIVDVLVVKDD